LGYFEKFFFCFNRTENEAIKLYNEFLGNLSCSNMLCLRNKSANDILKSQNAVSSFKASLNSLTVPEQWVPVVDDFIIKGQLLNVNQWLKTSQWFGKQKFTPKPIIVGTTSGEGIGFVFGELENPLSWRN
jgi:hypothetical protein